MDKFSKHRVCLNLASDEIYQIYDEIQSLSTTITKEKPLFDGILSKDELVVLVTPIDASSPKGRLILPQITAIREILDHHSNILISQNCNINSLLQTLKAPPALVVSDSRAILEVVKNSPKELKITTFSILMARQKGDLKSFIDGANRVDMLKKEDKILIAEACHHQYTKGDIAIDKIPIFKARYKPL